MKRKTRSFSVLTAYFLAMALLANVSAITHAAEPSSGEGLSLTGKTIVGPSSAPGTARNDFDSDTGSDLLAVRGDGVIGIGLLNGSNFQSFDPVSVLDPAAGWSVNSTADMNGDNQSDLFLYNSTTGEIRITLINGNSIISDEIAMTLDPTHNLVPVGASDFDGDGRAEILLHDSASGFTALMLFDNSGAFTSIEPAALIDTAGGFQLYDTGDFNGDGKTDLLSFNETTGDVTVILLDGTNIISQATAFNLDPTEEWVIQETGDFDGDGKEDILLLHSNGVVNIITMDGTAPTGQYTPGLLQPGWRIINAGNYDSDDKADLLIQDTVTSFVHSVIQDGTTITSVNFVIGLGITSGWQYHSGKALNHAITIDPIALSEADFKRFLEQSTWGPTPALLTHVSGIGKAAFLDEQFAATPSTYPDPIDGSDSLRPLRETFFYNAFHGDDQLRQRVAFALSQLFVVSANTVRKDEQLVPYMRMLRDNAFGNFYDLMEDVTLSSTMGVYLDMINNDKPKPEKGLNPNENYARELLQLFTIGLNLLNQDGTEQTDSNGDPIPTFSEDVILNLSRVFTGWTYPTLPGKTPKWTNPKNYDGPMEAIEEHHDTDPKVLMNGFAMPGGQTAREDLDMALRHIFDHPNVGPFIATRLIRHLVKSNPSKEYVQRVAMAFNSNETGVRGDMKSVLTAILLDPEAGESDPDGGHLREPVLYCNALLRALGADVEIENTLYKRTREMGQDLFTSPSVFNYFSPLHRPSGLGLFGPEFQIHTQSATFARANFVDKTVNSKLGEGVSVDLSSFESITEDLALIQAIEAALLHEPLSTTERNSIIAAINVPKISGGTRVEVAVYLVATSSRYQVQH